MKEFFKTMLKDIEDEHFDTVNAFVYMLILFGTMVIVMALAGWMDTLSGIGV